MEETGNKQSETKRGSDDNPVSQATPERDEGEARDTTTTTANVDDSGDQDHADGGKIYVPRKYDVLLGRGRPLQDHPGNLRFHRIINRARASYVNSRKEGKAGIAKEVLYEIKTSKKNPENSVTEPPIGDGDIAGDDVNSPSSGGEPGRFLKKVGDGNASGEEVYWIEVSQEVAIEKISHALRGRPRSETSDRSDGTGGSKGSGNSGGGKGQSSGNPKRKGPPSPPTNETASTVAVGTDVSGLTAGGGASIEAGRDKALQSPNVTDAIFATNANAPNTLPTVSNFLLMSLLPTSNNNSKQMAQNKNVDSNNAQPAQPTYNAMDNQLQSILSAWQLQQFQAAMQIQQQNAQQIAQQQFFQQLIQQQQIAPAGVGGTGAAPSFGQNQQPPLNSGVLSAQQQQLQLMVLQQQIQQLLQQAQQQQQQQQQQLQPTPLQPQQLQFALQQNLVQQQQQVQSSIQQSQQTQAQQQLGQFLQQPTYPQQQGQTTTSSSSSIGNPASSATTGGTNRDPNSVDFTTAILSAIANTPAVNNQSMLAAQQPQLSLNQATQNPQQMVQPIGTSQVVPSSNPQVQTQLLQQSLELLLAPMYAQQPLQQMPTSAPNSGTPPGNPPPSSNPPSGDPSPPNNPS